jgi:diadenylate cyclase
VDSFANLFFQRLLIARLSQPLVLLDLVLALFLIVFSLYYLRNFPIFRVILGTLLLLSIGLIFFYLGFIFTALVFGFVSCFILISTPLIFAPEVRHYLEKLGRFPFLKRFYGKKQTDGYFIRNLVDAVFELAERKIGATIVIQRKTSLGEIMETGVTVDAAFGSKILQSVFWKDSPLHDGAAIMVGQRIMAVGCLLPIFPDIKLDLPFGTRHQSGISVTRDTDAISIIVSEERGEVSLAENRKLTGNIDRVKLREKLDRLL